jgi:proteasome alpha subunit
MYTPYDWQEGIGHRAQYIEAKLAQGAPVIGVSLDAGILFFTFRRQGRKLFEIYDRLIFGALGQQSDVESVRLAALEFCSREGFNRS